MKVFITGASGFIGTHFVRICLSKKDTVVALIHNKPLLFGDISSMTCINKPFNCLTKEDFCDVDILVHFACHSANVPYDNLENCLKYNVIQPLEMLNVAKGADVKNFLVIG